MPLVPLGMPLVSLLLALVVRDTSRSILQADAHFYRFDLRLIKAYPSVYQPRNIIQFSFKATRPIRKKVGIFRSALMRALWLAPLISLLSETNDGRLKNPLNVNDCFLKELFFLRLVFPVQMYLEFSVDFPKGRSFTPQWVNSVSSSLCVYSSRFMAQYDRKDTRHEI